MFQTVFRLVSPSIEAIQVSGGGAAAAAVGERKAPRQIDDRSSQETRRLFRGKPN